MGHHVEQTVLSARCNRRCPDTLCDSVSIGFDRFQTSDAFGHEQLRPVNRGKSPWRSQPFDNRLDNVTVVAALVGADGPDVSPM